MSDNVRTQKYGMHNALYDKADYFIEEEIYESLVKDHELVEYCYSLRELNKVKNYFANKKRAINYQIVKDNYGDIDYIRIMLA